MTTYYSVGTELSVPSWNKTKPGDLLRKCRLRAGLTQDQLAEKLHRSRSSISKIENDKVRVDVPTFLNWMEHTRSLDLLVSAIILENSGIMH